MAEEHFSWLPDEPAFKIAEETQSSANKAPKENSFKKVIFAKMLEHKAGMIVVVLLLVAIFAIKIFQGDEIPQNTRLEVMTAVLPLPKGKIIEAILLRPTLVSAASFTKAQKFELLGPDDAEKIMGKLRAKKDIPPNKPIFWSELELLPETKAAVKSIAPTIIYSEDSK